MTGAVDAIDKVDTKTAQLLSRNPKIVIEESTGPLHYVFAMQMTTPPFDNVHVRQALKLSVDREEFVRKILNGHGEAGNDHPIGKSYRYVADDIEKNSYDPEKAKWHLKQAGMDSLTVDLHTSDAAFAGAIDAAALFQNNARKAGIEINIIREPNDGYWSNVWGKKPFVVSYWGGYPTEDVMFTTGYTTGASWNETKFSDEEFEKLLSTARAESDDEKRRGMYREMQIILRDRGGVIVPAFANDLVARTNKVAHGEHVSPLKAFDGRRIIERWWVA
jgi:peptide/nickel transport system substrate-binding protein